MSNSNYTLSDSIEALQKRKQWLYDKICLYKVNDKEHGYLNSEFVAIGRALEYMLRESRANQHKKDETDSAMLRRLANLFTGAYDFRDITEKKAKRWKTYLEDLATRLEKENE